MAGRVNLTERFAKTARADGRKSPIFYDDEVIGFGLQVRDNVLAAHKNKPFADIIRMLMLTGARRGEVLNARWEQFDLDAAVWTKPAATTKQRRLHRTPISCALVQLQMALDYTPTWHL